MFLCSKKSKVQSANLAPAILQGLMPITVEPEPEDVEDDAPCRSALRNVNTLPPSPAGAVGSWHMKCMCGCSGHGGLYGTDQGGHCKTNSRHTLSVAAKPATSTTALVGDAWGLDASHNTASAWGSEAASSSAPQAEPEASSTSANAASGAWTNDALLDQTVQASAPAASSALKVLVLAKRSWAQAAKYASILSHRSIANGLCSQLLAMVYL